VGLDRGDDLCPIGMVVEDVILDLVVVGESQVAVWALVRGGFHAPIIPL
jgi:hypothetical protein